MIRTLPIALGAMLLAGCGSEPAEPEATSDTTAPAATSDAPEEVVEVAAADAQPAKLAQCKTCHTFEKDGPMRVGPNLWGVHGSPAGSKEGYAYSKALTDSGLVWDDATLSAYIENPRAVIPGGKMVAAGIKGAEDRAEVIAYLASLKDDAVE